MNKFIPKTSSPKFGKYANTGPHNPNVGTTGLGKIAPKPQGGAALLGNDRPSSPDNGGLARVKKAPMGPNAGNFLPVRKPMPGLQNQRVGQKEMIAPGAEAQIRPQTKTAPVSNPVATNKPKRRGLGANFMGEYS